MDRSKFEVGPNHKRKLMGSNNSRPFNAGCLLKCRIEKSALHDSAKEKDLLIVNASYLYDCRDSNPVDWKLNVIARHGGGQHKGLEHWSFLLTTNHAPAYHGSYFAVLSIEFHLEQKGGMEPWVAPLSPVNAIIACSKGWGQYQNLAAFLPLTSN